MSTLLTDAQITALGTSYDMGRVWESATDAEKILAVRTVEASWRALPWRISPFDNTSIAAQLYYVLARAARYVLENQGSQGTSNSEIDSLIEPFLAGGRAAPIAYSDTKTGSNTLTGTQIIELIDNALGSTAWRTGG